MRHLHKVPVMVVPARERHQPLVTGDDRRAVGRSQVHALVVPPPAEPERARNPRVIPDRLDESRVGILLEEQRHLLPLLLNDERREGERDVRQRDAMVAPLDRDDRDSCSGDAAPDGIPLRSAGHRLCVAQVQLLLPLPLDGVAIHHSLQKVVPAKVRTQPTVVRLPLGKRAQQPPNGLLHGLQRVASSMPHAEPVVGPISPLHPKRAPPV
mmetsp:Transcript_20949/g.66367  ORF Transcript_20949/g.66367 Transcript_20949/m.66367 type:complete len:211 (-) Transcript_20949:452-1084(-)